jgi:hypothetical protein
MYTNGANCLDAETEALTERGWVRGFDLLPSDKLLAKSRTDGVLRYTKPHVINQFPDYSGPMVEFASRSFSAMTTPNHRWLVLREGAYVETTSDGLLWTDAIADPRGNDIALLDCGRRETWMACPVWCPTMPSDEAFVVRRRGTVYLSLNSSFQGLASDLAKDAVWRITQEMLEREIEKARAAKAEHSGKAKREKRVIGFRA